ncbi:MAG: aminopeptidase [Parasporobacterium sp.]|nr:aminopeptidase [Parasporobacterium sp.]
MNDIEQLKADYAELIIKEGLNIQKGQRLVINCPVECADFARLCTDAAYSAGCREVLVRWSDDYLTRARFLHAENDVFDHVDPWDTAFLDGVSEEGAAWLAVHAENPANLNGVDPDRINRYQIARGKATEKFRQREMTNYFPWCVCSVPTGAWAAAVFPDMEKEDAILKLWEEILKACLVDGGNAVENWHKHSDELHRHVEMLNEYNFRYLHYKNAAGTDLMVELPEGHFWAGGNENTQGGVQFSANIPTEEVFTLPKRDSVNGKIVASKPLVHNGNIISNFYFIVKDGRIIEAHAEEGDEILKAAISVDEGASYFGEVALVPYDSPISESGILFLNTLFDENASCHFAFGEAYPCLKGTDGKSEEELKAMGVNFSMTHVDFMIGTRDLSITGIRHDGTEVPVFVNGNFAF